MTNSAPPLWSPWQSVAFIVLATGGMLMFTFTFAIDARFSIAGDPRSLLRFAWGTGAVVSGIVGTLRLMAVIDRMLKGDPELPYPPPRPSRTQAP